MIIQYIWLLRKLFLGNNNIELIILLSLQYMIHLWYIDITTRAPVIHAIFQKRSKRSFLCILQCAICFPRFLVHNFNWKANKEEKCINKYNDQICTLFEKVFNLLHFFKLSLLFCVIFAWENWFCVKFIIWKVSWKNMTILT